MSFRLKVFLSAFGIIFLALMIVPAVEWVTAEYYNALFFSVSIFIATGAAFFCTFLLHGHIKKETQQVKDFVRCMQLNQYQRRLSFAHASAYASLMTPINALATHFEEHNKDLNARNTQLLTILNTMEEGVLVLTPNGSIQQYNKALQKMFPKVEKSLGLQVVEAIPVPSLQEAVDATLLQKNINNFKDFTPQETGALHLELELERTFSVHLTRAGTNDAHLGAVMVFHDISPIVRLERVRRDFVANVSHELRTPLTAIQGYAETLVNTDEIPDEYKCFVETIRRNGAYLARMVEELLALARLENAHMPVRIGPIAPQESLQAAIALCRQQLDLRSISVRIDGLEELMVMGNSQHLTQIFRNLIENAGRYAPEGDEIYVHAQSFGDENLKYAHMTLFSIADKGPGIPHVDLKRIFERFYRVEKHRSQGSTGLGLAICKHTVERLGGHIWVESPSQGYATVFYFTLPTFIGEQCE